MKVKPEEFLNNIGELSYNKILITGNEESLMAYVRDYIINNFKKKNYFIDWSILKKLDEEQLIDTICMISPLSVEEKQKLLETKKIDDKLYALNEILNFNLHTKSETQTVH